MKEMFEASVDGEAFDMERWGQYFKPAGMGGSGQATGSGASAPAKAVSAPAKAAQEDEAPFDVEATKASAPAPTGGSEASSRAQDILAKIKARQTT
jgi:hypothetical protein